MAQNQNSTRSTPSRTRQELCVEKSLLFSLKTLQKSVNGKIFYANQPSTPTFNCVWLFSLHIHRCRGRAPVLHPIDGKHQGLAREYLAERGGSELAINVADLIHL